MKRKKKSHHPDFWGREGRGGAEWDVVDRTRTERGRELGPHSFERPPQRGTPERTPARSSSTRNNK